MNFYKHPEPFVQLRHFYWNLRNRRSFDLAARQRWYRRIRAERFRLADIGFSVEHLRLYCRYLSNPVPKSAALHRLETFEAMLVEFARIQGLAKLQGSSVVPKHEAPSGRPASMTDVPDNGKFTYPALV